MFFPKPRNTLFRSSLFVRFMVVFFCLYPLTSIAQNTDRDKEPFLSLGEKHEIYSNVLEELRNVIVGLPSDYDDGDESYPVVYLLDGPQNFHHTSSSARFLAANGRMPGVIVVAIANTDRVRDMIPPTREENRGIYSTAGGAGNFLAFINGELRPYIAEHYRTRPYSILIGHSFGGLFVNYVLVHHPKMFNAYISISPSLWWDKQRLIAQADSAFDNADGLVGDFYMTLGNEGSDMVGGALKFAALLEEKMPDSFRWEFKRMEEESHGSIPYLSTYYGFEKIFDGWSLHDPVGLYKIGGLSAVDRYFEHASKRFGYEKSTSSLILYQIGGKALEDKNASEAEAIYSRIVEQSPVLATGHNGLAEAHALMGHKNEAIEHYKHALGCDPRNEKARKKLAEYGIDLSAYPETVDVPIHVLESYVGKYSDSNMEFEIVLDRQDLSIILDGSSKFEIFPVSIDRFKFVIGDLYVTFKADVFGSMSTMTFEQPGEIIEAVRIE